MKTIEFFDRKGYNPKYETIGGEVIMDGICVGEWIWNWPRTKILFKAGSDHGHCAHKQFDTFEDAAKWIAECVWFKNDHDYWDGAAHYYFDTKTGYDHISNYLRWFPLVKKYTVTIES